MHCWLMLVKCDLTADKEASCSQSPSVRGSYKQVSAGQKATHRNGSARVQRGGPGVAGWSPAV